MACCDGSNSSIWPQSASGPDHAGRKKGFDAMFIRTARLFLRPCWREDRHEMLALIGDGAPAPSPPALPWPLTAGDTQRFIDRPGDQLLPHFFITLPGSPGTGLIGGIGLGRDGGEVGLGYWIAAAHRGHGYAAE